MKHVLAILLSFCISYSSFSQESLKIVWPEEYGWKVLTNEESEGIHILELIPEGENGNNWTILGQMMSLKGVAGIPIDDIEDLMIEQVQTLSPDAKYTLIEKDGRDDYPWLLFKVENSTGTPDMPHTESQLWYVRQGATSLYMTFVAVKKKKLKGKFIKEWTTIFKDSEIVQL